MTALVRQTHPHCHLGLLPLSNSLGSALSLTSALSEPLTISFMSPCPTTLQSLLPPSILLLYILHFQWSSFPSPKKPSLILPCLHSCPSFLFSHPLAPYRSSQSLSYSFLHHLLSIPRLNLHYRAVAPSAIGIRSFSVPGLPPLQSSESLPLPTELYPW